MIILQSLLRKKLEMKLRVLILILLKKNLQYEINDEINIDNRKEIYDFNESDGDESHFLKTTFQQLQQSNQINQQIIAMKKGSPS